MKNIFLIVCLVLISPQLFSQNISFIYEMKYKISSAKDYYKTELFYLDIEGEEAVFRSEHDRSSDSLIQKTGYALGFKINYNHQYYTHKIRTKNVVDKIISTPIFGDTYSLMIENLKWRILNDKLKIGNFNCQKAELEYGGRKWTAWFAQEIPFQEGPYVFNGLPGLIIKISDETSDFDFELIKIKNNLKSIPHLKAKKEITWQVFKKLQDDFYKDPYAEVKARSIGYVNANEKGERIEISMKKMTESMQKSIRDNDNFIEVDQAVKYD